MSKTSDLKLQCLKELTNTNLSALLCDIDFPSKRLADAIKYSVLTGASKRLRPILVYLTGEVLAIEQAKLHHAACAIELIHCYSLIHDDLPAMDDDDLRHGIPSCHCAFDEATAILAGDALQALAFELIATTDTSVLSALQKNDMIIAMCKSCGVEGMVSGQALDLELLGNDNLAVTKLAQIHQLKTGKLLTLCINMALIAAQVKDPVVIQAFFKFAHNLGIAYQIQDDYLDKYATTQQLGKPQGSDAAQGKHTYAALFSKQELHALIEQHYHQAIDALSIFAQRAIPLTDFIQFLLNRNH